MNIHYCYGLSKTDAHPKMFQAADFDQFVSQVLAFPRARTKGRAYICAPLRRNGSAALHRCKIDVLPRSWLGHDLDGGSREEVDILLMRLSDYLAIAWQTASSTMERPRWRIILFLDREVDRAEGVRLGTALVGVLGDGLSSLKWDKSTHHGEQPCFLPLVGAQVMQYHGDPVDVDSVLALVPEEPQRERPVPPDPYEALIIEHGLFLHEIDASKAAITCPFEEDHSEKTSESSTVYFRPLHNGYRWGRIFCSHTTHCKDRTQEEFIRKLGGDPQGVWREQARGNGAAEAGEESSPGKGGAKKVPEEFPSPQPLTAKVAPPEPYPLDALPGIVRDAVMEVQGFVKAPVPLVASSAQTSMSMATQAHIDVRRADKLEGPTSLFSLTIADSGERKTTCDTFFTKVIREYDAQEADLARDTLKKYDAIMSGWKAEREGIALAIRNASKAGREGTASVLKQRLIEFEEQKPEQPRVPKLLRMDDTPEKLAWVLAKEWPSVGVVSSEGGIILGAHAMGQYSIMRNLGLLNTVWDGGGLGVGRRTSESFEMQVARLTIGLQVQEATLRNFLDQSGGLPRSTGFLARVLMSWPESTQGFRPFTEAPGAWPVLSAFNRRLAEILKKPIPFDDKGLLAPRMLSLTKQAKGAWIDFFNSIEVELRCGGDLYDVRDVASKCADNAVRLAALFQYFDDGAEGGVVELEAFEGASRIAAWHLNESRRFFGELALPAELAGAARLDAWLIENCRRTSSCCVGKRHAQQYGPLRDSAALNLAIDELEDLDRVRLVKEGKRLDLYLNPALLFQ